MREVRGRYSLLMLLCLVLMLGLAFSGLAQETSPGNTGDNEEPGPETITDTVAITDAMAITVSDEITEPLVVSPTLISEEISVPPAITDTQVMTDDLQLPPAIPISQPAISPTPGSEPQLQLTVYNTNLGLVKEIRSLELEEGANTVRFSDVSARIDPTSVHIAPLTATNAVRVLEQNYEYDIVSSQKLLTKYIDQEIELTTQSGTTYSGTLLSGHDDVVLKTADGVRIIKLDQIQEFAFPELPEGLITKPTLVWLLDAAGAGDQDVRVTYLTGGITWNADYVAMLNATDTQLSLNGWISLDNQSGATYENAQLKLVAGDINRVPQLAMYAMDAEEQLARVAAVPQVEERTFFEYHLYQIARPVTVRDNQTKQIEFVTTPAVQASKIYVYEPSPHFVARQAITEPAYGRESDTSVSVMVEFSNSEESGLGIPLPTGNVRVYKADLDGSAELVGEDRIDHTPQDEDLTLLLGDAFDIIGERTQIETTKLGDNSMQETIQIEIRNHKEEELVVLAREHLFRAEDAVITDASLDYEMVDATTAEFDVAIAADASKMLTYTVLYRW